MSMVSKLVVAEEAALQSSVEEFAEKRSVSKHKLQQNMLEQKNKSKLVKTHLRIQLKK